ncbi:MAG: WYL domain-containing protein [Ruminococcus sp.]|nr:WYL domain-containing protein [Ruminococcus sp.]
MARSSRQKQKLLYLQKIMIEKTDENHGLTVNEIIEALAAYGIKSERKSLYDDLNILEVYGIDICKTRTSTVKYYVGNRNFQIAELKLLVDAIQSSKFITHKKSLELIEKLEKLASENEGKQLQRQVFVTNRVKNANEKIYYNVDPIHNAIAENRQITFKYCMWQVNFGGESKIIRTERKNGAVYRVSPWALCWDDENYYLIAYDSESEMIKHYRVDKMESIQIAKDEREGMKSFEKFDIAGYTKGVFSMFGGEEACVELSVDNGLIGVIVDRFGSDIFIKEESENTFVVTVKVMLSPQFYAWVFGLGDKIKILSPKRAVDEYREKLKRLTEAYL